jgi:hypothetical protein
LSLGAPGELRADAAGLDALQRRKELALLYLEADSLKVGSSRGKLTDCVQRRLLAYGRDLRAAKPLGTVCKLT